MAINPSLSNNRGNNFSPFNIVFTVFIRHNTWNRKTVGKLPDHPKHKSPQKRYWYTVIRGMISQTRKCRLYQWSTLTLTTAHHPTTDN
jgi:hypothetical protein